MQERNNLLGVQSPPPVILNPFCSIHLSSTTNLADQDNTLGIRIMLEDTESINKIGASQHVSTHTDAKTLTKSSPGSRCHGLIT